MDCRGGNGAYATKHGECELGFTVLGGGRGWDEGAG